MKWECSFFFEGGGGGGGQTTISTFARLGCQWIEEICAPFQIPSDPTVKAQNMIYLTSMLERSFSVLTL